ncbi:hypothetical protein G6011_11223 [Alternaria panax]|uniref:Heterokaryon incompatibility domain-containing protein n=1 Tax=Alternaria panax TaxID=48097 RepID=A0AAD4NRZ9_9PLEO|nr:hypothetical protein G6011_11223 [Alternaria panax]
MQKDTHLTFREIHGGPEAMLASMREIQELALYRKQPDQLLSLRFLSLAVENLPDHQQRSDTVYLQLSPLIPIPGPYLTISYTWQHSRSMTNDIPQYVVLRPGAASVQVDSELNHVMYRTFRFAAHQGIHHFWIDQLCVDQTDPLDVEKHLQSTNTRDCLTIEDDLIISIDHIQHIIQASRKNDKVPKGSMPSSPAREQARRLWELFREFFVERAIIAGKTNSIFWNRYIMKAIDKCDNLVVSDRLAIHSNIRHHNWRLRTTQLQNARYSYSTCSLVLVLSNYLLFSEKSSREHFRLPIDQTVVEVIGMMGASEQLCLVHQPPSSEGETTIVFPLWTEKSLEKITSASQVQLDVGLSSK